MTETSWIDTIQPPHATVTGQYVAISHDSADPNLTPDVQPLNGAITLTPTVTAGRIEDVLAQIRPVTVRVFGGQIVDDEDAPGARVLATDVDLGVEDWAWTATFEFDGGLKLRPVTFKAPAGTTVNLTSRIIPVSSAPYQIVQGEPGESAYQVAVRNGYAGTEAEWLASLEGVSDWDDLTGKPASFPPASHTHTIAEVEGLQDRIDAALYDSGRRNVASLLGLTSGAAWLTVYRGWVQIVFENAVAPGTGNTALTPDGLLSVAPEAPMGALPGNILEGGGTLRRAEVNRFGRVLVYAYGGGPLNGSLSWPMTRPAPATWPGAAT